MADYAGMTDGELVGAVNGGDWGAFDAIYFRHRDWAYRLAWRFCGDEADAQDAVQEVFIYLAGKFPGMKLTAEMTTLLYPAVKHTSLAIRRKRRRVLPEAEMRRRGDAAMEGPAEGTGREELAAVLKGLGDDHREVLLMRFVDDMSLDEIAGALAIPLGTAKSRLHHAVKELREDPRARKYWEA